MLFMILGCLIHSVELDPPTAPPNCEPLQWNEASEKPSILRQEGCQYANHLVGEKASLVLGKVSYSLPNQSPEQVQSAIEMAYNKLDDGLYGSSPTGFFVDGFFDVETHKGEQPNDRVRNRRPLRDA